MRFSVIRPNNLNANVAVRQFFSRRHPETGVSKQTRTVLNVSVIS